MRPPQGRPGEAPADIGILVVDGDLVVRAWDGWLARATGIPADRACGRPLAEVVPDLRARGLLQRFEQVLASAEVQVLAPAFHHYLVPCPPSQPSPNFDRMQQRVTLGPLREGDRTVGVMATVEDVTARIDRERELAAALRADDWKLRREAVEDLTRIASPDMLVSLISALRTEHRDFNVLSSALQLLGATDMDVTGPIVALLQEPDADLRIQAALALGERHTPAAIEALIGALADPDVNVRFHAIEALGRMRAGEAVDALADVAEGDDFFLVFPAIDALARMHDARVAPRLIPLLQRRDVVEPVAEALGELGGADVVRPLVDVLNAAGPAAPLARALTRLHERYEQQYGGGALVATEFQSAIRPAGSQRILDALGTATGADLTVLVTVLGWLRGPAVERALARLLGEASVRPAVIEAIVRQEAGVVDLLIEQLRAEDGDVRLAAIVALGRLGNRRATRPLAGMLGHARAEAVAAASALARLADPDAFDALLPLLAHDDAAVRQAAIGALNSLGHPQMASRVAELLSADDHRLRESAVRIAGYFGYAECVDALIARAGDGDERVRRAAVEHLPFLDDPRAVVSLTAALADASGAVRAAAVQAFAHVDNAEAREPLLRATTDADPWVRYYAVRSIATLGDAGAVGRLGEIAASDPAMHVRIAAVEAIGATSAGDATDLLVRHAGESQSEIASAALRSLGRLRDARAVAVLKSALRSEDPARKLAAVTGLRAAGTVEGVEALEWTAAGDNEESVAMAAVEALGHIAATNARHDSRDDDAGAAIAALIGATAEERRRQAATLALSRLPERRIARVADGLSHAHPVVRRAIVDVLARMRHPQASTALRQALEDAEPGVRAAAVTALDQLGVRGLAPRFAQLARDDESRSVRRAAMAALGRAAESSPGGEDEAR
jgi:HEAT repeat protein